MQSAISIVRRCTRTFSLMVPEGIQSNLWPLLRRYSTTWEEQMTQSQLGARIHSYDPFSSFKPIEHPPLLSDAAIAQSTIVVGNQPLNFPGWKDIWAKAEYRVCADGGANRLYDSLSPEERTFFIPEDIVGDLDSVRQEVIEFYLEHGTNVTKDTDEDKHDLEKTLDRISHRNASSFSPHHDNVPDVDPPVYLIGFMGGRFDQEVANLDMLWRFSKRLGGLTILTKESAVRMLNPGDHLITLSDIYETPVCGLFSSRPFFTQGLKWNIEGDPQARKQMRAQPHQNPRISNFTVMSSSNQVVGCESTGPKQVKIKTINGLVMWTTQLKEVEGGASAGVV